MDARNDLLLVLFILFVLGIMWAASGGPERASSLRPFIKPLPPIGSGEIYGTAKDIEIRASAERRGFFFFISPKIRISSETKLPQDEEISDQGNIISFEKRTSGAKQTDPSREHVIIRADKSNAQPILITGWKLISASTGRQVEIGKGVKLFFAGDINKEQPLFLRPGERAVITSGRSPIGVSFLTNKCTGYFEQFQNFQPSLPRICPTPEQELELVNPDLRFFGDDCLDFIERIPRCTLVLKSLPPNFPVECREFIIDELNYAQCVVYHKDDFDFFAAEWRVFLDHDQELWKKKREIIKLVDSEGNLIDTLSY